MKTTYLISLLTSSKIRYNTDFRGKNAINVPHECNITKKFSWVNLQHNFEKKVFFQFFRLKYERDLAELVKRLIFKFYTGLYPKCDERQGKIFTVVLPTTLSCFPTIFWVH